MEAGRAPAHAQRRGPGAPGGARPRAHAGGRALKLLLGLLGLAAGLGAATRSELIAEGNAGLRGRDYRAASRAFLEAARLNTNDPGPLYGVGAAQFMLGRTATAKAFAELALARDPNQHATLVLMQRLGLPEGLVRGQQALAAGRADLALAAFDEALRSLPDDGLAWRGRSEALRQLGRLEEAQAALERAAALEPSHLDLAPLRRRQEASLDAYLRQVDPLSEAMRRGVRAYRAGRLEEAEAAFRDATQAAPEDATAWAHLGLARWKRGDAEGTRAALERALSLDARQPQALFLRGAYLARAGQAEAAREQFSALSRLGDGDLAALAARQLAALGPGALAQDGPHVYLRLLGGAQRSVSNNGVSDTAQDGWGSQDYLRLSYDAFSAGWHPFSAAYSAYVTPAQLGAAAFSWGEPYHALDLGQRFKPGGAWEPTLGYSGSLRQRSDGGADYLAQAAKAGLDWRPGWASLLSLQGQALWERFPDYADYDSVSGLASLAATFSWPQGHALVLTLGGRVNSAANPLWSYQAAWVSLWGQLQLPWRLALQVNAQVQPQLYPNASDGGGGQRLDRGSYLSAELSRPLPVWGGAVSLLAGAQASANASNLAYDNSSGWLAYAGLQVYR